MNEPAIIAYKALTEEGVVKRHSVLIFRQENNWLMMTINRLKNPIGFRTVKLSLVDSTTLIKYLKAELRLSSEGDKVISVGVFQLDRA